MTRKNKNKQVAIVPLNSQPLRELNSKIEEVVVVKTNKSKSKSARRNQRRRARKNRGLALRSNFRPSEKSFFQAALLAPDLYGPIRQPRAGGSTRTGLAIDLTVQTITGSATNTIQGIQANSFYNDSVTGSVNTLTATTAATGFTIAGNGTIGSQFPNPNQIADCNLVSLSLVAYYIGNPLNVQGEVILGQSIPISGTSTYNAMYFYPGTVRIPVADLVACPRRVSLRKLSPVADEFVPVANGNADVDLPFIITSGLPTGGILKILVTRCFEYRSTTVSSLVIPYEKVGPEYSTDLMAFQDAKANISQMDSTFTEALPNSKQPDGLSFTSLLCFGASFPIGYAINSAVQSRYNQIVAGRNRAASMGEYEHFEPFEAYLNRV